MLLCLISLRHKDSSDSHDIFGKVIAQRARANESDILWKAVIEQEIYSWHFDKSHCIPITCSSLVLCARHAAVSWSPVVLCRAHRGRPVGSTLTPAVDACLPIRAHPSWTHPALDTSQHFSVLLHQNDVWEHAEQIVCPRSVRMSSFTRVQVKELQINVFSGRTVLVIKWRLLRRREPFTWRPWMCNNE